MMKRVVSVLLGMVLLVLVAAPALAGQGDKAVLSQTEMDTWNISNVFVADGKIYMLMDGLNLALKEYDLETGALKDYDLQALSDRMRGLTDTDAAEGEEAGKSAAEEQAGASAEPTENWLESPECWFVWRGEIYALVNRSLYQDGSNRIDGGHVRKLMLREDGTADLAAEDAAQLDWTEMVETSGSWSSSRYLSYSTVQGDLLYASSWGSTGNQELFIFDLTTGRMRSYVIQEMNEFTVLSDGRVLVNQYLWGDESFQVFCFFDPETETLEKLARFSLGEGQVSMLAYDPETDVIYFARGGELYAAPERDLTKAQAVNDCPASGRIFAPLLPDGRLLIWSYSAVFLRNTDPALRSHTNLRIRPFAWSRGLESTALDFANDHSDIGVIREEWGDESTLLQSMMNRDASVDIYLISADTSAFNAVYDRGFLADLSGDEKLMETVTGMYPFASEIATRNGKLVAMPVYASGSTLGYNPQALEKLGMTDDDLPKTWDEYFDFLQQLPERLAGTEFRPFETYTYRDELQRSMLGMILTQFSVNHGDEKMDNDLVRGLLERIKQIDFDALGLITEAEQQQMEEEGVYYEADETMPQTALLNVWAEPLMSSSSDSVSLCLALSADEDPVVPVSMSVACVNPYSEHQEEAKLFLESLVEHLDTTTRYSFFPGLTEPVRSPYYQDEKEYMEKWLKTAQKNAAEAEDEETRKQWEDLVADYQKSLENIENNDWLISPQSIAGYQKRTQHVRVVRWNYYSALSDADSGEQYWDLQAGFVQGTATARELLSFIDKKVQMMRLEGN